MTIFLTGAIPMIAIGKRRVASKSEIFAKVGMPSRFLARQASAIFPGLAGRLNGVNDSRIARAAAKMARKSLLDSFATARAALPQHRGRTDNDPGNAEAALNSPFKHERFAQHIPHFFGNALKGNHFPAFHLFRLPQA